MLKFLITRAQTPSVATMTFPSVTEKIITSSSPTSQPVGTPSVCYLGDRITSRKVLSDFKRNGAPTPPFLLTSHSSLEK